MHDMPLNKASSLLSSYFGYEVRIEDATPLVQWANTTAYRLKLQHPRQNGSCPDTAIMKGPYEGYDASYLAMWRPAWRLAQDYVNLRFFHEVGAGQYVPTLYAYDPQAGFILMQDLGEMDLHKFLTDPTSSNAWNTIVGVAQALGHLHGVALPHAFEFPPLALSLVPGFEPVFRAQALTEEENYENLLVIDRHFGGSNSPDPVHEYAEFTQRFSERNRFFGHVAGDLWHQHVILSKSNPCFVDFHCGGPDIVLMDLFRLLEGSPSAMKRQMPEQLIKTAKAAYLDALAEGAGWDSDRGLGDDFELIYACTAIRQYFCGSSRLWIHLRRDEPETWGRIRGAMQEATRLLQEHLPELPSLMDLAFKVNRWFEENRPPAKAKRERYPALSHPKTKGPQTRPEQGH